MDQKGSDIVLVCKNGSCHPKRRYQLFEGEKYFNSLSDCKDYCKGKDEDDYTVRVPKEDVSLDQELVDRYLEGFCSGTQNYQVLKTLLDATQVVSFRQFQSNLIKAVNRLLDLRGQDKSKWLVLPLNIFDSLQDETPYAWTTKLALSLFPELARQRLKEPDDIKELPTTYIFFTDVLDNDAFVRIVLDNAIDKLRDILKGRDVPIDIYVVAAYASDKAVKAIERMRVPSNININIVQGEKLLSLRQLLPELDSQTLLQMMRKLGSVDKFPYIFSHRMLGQESSYPEFYSGYIPVSSIASEREQCPRRQREQVIPFLRGCEETFEQALKGRNSTKFQSSPIECPYPPYKRPSSRPIYKEVGNFGTIMI